MSADRWKKSALKIQAKEHLACGQFVTMNVRINGNTCSGLISKVKKMFEAGSCDKVLLFSVDILFVLYHYYIVNA